MDFFGGLALFWHENLVVDVKAVTRDTSISMSGYLDEPFVVSDVCL
jgi:hypothetical protein